MVSEKQYKRLAQAKNNLKNKYKCLKKCNKNNKSSLKYHKNQNKKHQKTISEQSETIKNINKKISELENKLSTKTNISDDKIVVLCVLLFIYCGISFRSIPKILKIMFCCLDLKGWIPHETSIMAWAKKLSYYKLHHITKDNLIKYSAIIDITVNKSSYKLLTVLRLPVDIYRNRAGGAKLLEAETIGIYAAETWNKHSIFNKLNSLFSRIGYPFQLLVDGGCDLKAGIKLLNQNLTQVTGIRKITVVNDIGHIFANLLKKKYKNCANFKNFTKKLLLTSSRLRCTKLSHLSPTKLRLKGRFQSIKSVIKWSLNTLVYFKIRKRSSKTKYQKLLKRSLGWLKNESNFLLQLESECDLLNKIQNILKIFGVNQKSYQSCIQELESSSIDDFFRKEIGKILKKYIQQASLLGGSVNVSTDIIESVFGKQKYLLERSPSADLSTTALYLPAFTGNNNEELITNAMKHTKIKDIINFEKDLPESMLSKKLKLPKHSIVKKSF